MSVAPDQETTSQETARRQSPLVPVFAAVALAAAAIGYLLPDRTVGADMGGGMPMTHYMGLLAVNQPWNLLLFMAAPVILAETLAITELVLLFSAKPPAWVHTLSRFAGLVAGPLMVGIVVHLLRNAVIPLTMGGGWRGVAGVGDEQSTGLVELGIIGRDERHARKLHTVFVGVFLVVAHVAMIFGMLDPSVMGWDPSHVMPDGGTMPGMHH